MYNLEANLLLVKLCYTPSQLIGKYSRCTSIKFFFSNNNASSECQQSFFIIVSSCKSFIIEKIQCFNDEYLYLKLLVKRRRAYGTSQLYWSVYIISMSLFNPTPTNFKCLYQLILYGFINGKKQVRSKSSLPISDMGPLIAPRLFSILDDCITKARKY